MNQQALELNWPGLIIDCRTSGLSMAKWCRTDGLKNHQLNYRLQKAKQVKLKETGWLFTEHNRS